MSAKRPTEHNTELGRALRDARRKAGVRQEDVAKRLGCSQPSVTRLEKGSKVPTREQLDTLLDLYAPVPELRARIERFAHPEEHDCLTLDPKFDGMVTASEAAAAIHTFHSERIPMTLQSERYALKQYTAFDPSIQLTTVMRLRERRTRLFQRDEPPTYHAIMTVSSLLRMPGGQTDIVSEQAQHLLDLLDKTPSFTLRVLHLEAAIAYVETDFTLLKMPDRKDDMVYVPYGLDGRLIKDRARIEEREIYWHKAEQAALSAEETRDFLRVLADEGHAAGVRPTRWSS